MAEKTSTARRRRKQPESQPENVLAIDEHSLEREWNLQAPLYHNYAEQLAAARFDQDQAKAELDITSAELDSLIRESPEAYQVSRISESSIKNTILQQKEYQISLAKYNEATKAVRMLEAMTRALEHRRSALKCMVELRLANYYAEPTLGKSKQAYDEMQKQEVRSRGRR